jgi:hypothetical protein
VEPQKRDYQKGLVPVICSKPLVVNIDFPTVIESANLGKKNGKVLTALRWMAAFYIPQLLVVVVVVLCCFVVVFFS